MMVENNKVLCFMISGVLYGREVEVSEKVLEYFGGIGCARDGIVLCDLFVPRNMSVEMPSDHVSFSSKKLCPGVVFFSVAADGEGAVLTKSDAIMKLEVILTSCAKLLRSVRNGVKILSSIKKSEFYDFKASIETSGDVDDEVADDDVEGVDNFQYDIGDEVRVVGGAFAGINGIIHRLDVAKTGKRSVVLSVPFFGKQANVLNIDVAFIRPMSDVLEGDL